MRLALRDRIAISVCTFVLTHVATTELRGRITRALRTGNPEEQVPVDQVVLPSSHRTEK